MSFKGELLELKRQHHIEKRRDIKEDVDEFYRTHKDVIESKMRMSAKSGYTNAGFLIQSDILAPYNSISRNLFTKMICEILEFEYPDIKFEGYSDGEIVISWEE